MSIWNKLWGKKKLEVSLPVKSAESAPIKVADHSINYHLLKDSVVLNYEGKTFTLARNDKRFEGVVSAIKENRLQDIPGIVDVASKLSKAGFIFQDGLLKIKDEHCPEVIMNRIVELHSANLPFDSLFKFWDNLKQNPSLNSRQMLYQFLTHNGHPLTQDGHFIAYRGVSHDFKDKHTGTFDNSPGSICEIDRKEVNHDPNHTCSSGLHVACYDYAKDFGSGGKLIEVKVNPRDVVAVPVDYNGTKMRVCRFEVIRECDGMKVEPLYDHDEPESYNDEEVAEIGEVEGLSQYLVRPKGQIKWDRIQARSFEDAAKGSNLIGTVYVRKGSNDVRKFEL